LANPYLEKIRRGEVGTKELDEKVRRILQLAFRTNMNKSRPFGSLVSDEHILAGRKIAEDGIVLLKNDKKLLPIQIAKTRKIAVIGENAIKKMMTGGGSSSLKGKYEITIFEGLQNKMKVNGIEIVYARGYVGDVKTEYSGVTTGQNLNEERTEHELFEEACLVARDADYVIFVGGLNKSHYQDSEGFDRKSMKLPYNQDMLIDKLSKINKNLIVVNVSGNAVEMPWVNQVQSIVQCWYLGSEAGNALANVLTGDVNPSGKLPFTFPVRLEDNSAHALGEYPGKDDQVIYNEGIFVGYRWHDTKNIKPLFSFGHGLSYTNFRYGKLLSDKKVMTEDETMTFSIKVTNTGKVEGSEIIQLYIQDKQSSVERPSKELKGFKKVFLNPGESKEVSFVIDKTALSFFDDKRHDWVAEKGEFEAIVGSSSTDIKDSISFRLN
jgi:beta-glucosidase